MLGAYMQKAKQGQSVWLPDVRRALSESDEAVPVIFSLTLCTGERVDRCHFLPRWCTEEERRFAQQYLNACVFNTLSVYSGQELRFYPMEQEESVRKLLDGLPEAFSSGGLSKCISVANRISRCFGGGRFRFLVEDIKNYAPAPKEGETSCGGLAVRLRCAAEASKPACCCGVDIGGTDIKLVAAKGERLVCVKEFDWNPSESPTAEGILAPILLLIRLMRSCLAADGTELFTRLVPALAKEASFREMERAVSYVERVLGGKIDVLDAIGISFPDVVIHDRIIGGETPKTGSMRKNPNIDYESEFSKLTGLKETAAALCKAGGCVRIINDGSMAAFTAAMELAHSEDAQLIEDGVIAHSLGTDLGTGWLTGMGTVPPLPLELYDCLLDLGSLSKREFDAHDLRSVCNENSGLPGVRRYMGQAAAFRLAWELDPELLKDFIMVSGEMLTIKEKDPDLRKACLAYLMEQAEDGNAQAEQIFIRIGSHLGQVCREMEFLLHTGLRTRFLFGRFVKHPHCFKLLCQGCAQTAPEIGLIAADSGMAFTPLMKALDARQDVSVAQFGQAVGSAYYAFL